MEKRKILITTLVLLGSLLFGAIKELPDNKFHLVFCDVGQGDATLIVKGKNQILIDGGPNDKVLSCLANHMPFWDRNIELVILTHPDADHINGIVSVVDRYTVKKFVSNSLLIDSGSFGELRKEIINKNIPVYSPKEGDVLKLSKIEFDILFPSEKMGNELVWKGFDTNILGASYEGNQNKVSIVSKIVFGELKVLMAADIGTDEENQIEHLLEEVDILKIAHHGSKYSTSEQFLSKLSPKLAIISVGAKNTYGHPHSDTIQRLENLQSILGRKIKVLRTDLDGEIEVVSDGATWYTKKHD